VFCFLCPPPRNLKSNDNRLTPSRETVLKLFEKRAVLFHQLGSERMMLFMSMLRM
jgi:hypothetical protein